MSARPSGRPTSNAAGGRFPSWCTGFGRNTSTGSRRSARCRRRGSTAAIVGSMLDLMPSPRLIFHEWDRHGTCSGLSQAAYFEAVRKARAVVKIPAEFVALDKPITVKPDDVAEAFVKANPGLSRAASGGRLRQQALERSARVPEQGFFVPRLRRGDAPRLQARQHRHAGGARRMNGV